MRSLPGPSLSCPTKYISCPATYNLNHFLFIVVGKDRDAINKSTEKAQDLH